VLWRTVRYILVCTMQRCVKLIMLVWVWNLVWLTDRLWWHICGALRSISLPPEWTYKSIKRENIEIHGTAFLELLRKRELVVYLREVFVEREVSHLHSLWSCTINWQIFSMSFQNIIECSSSNHHWKPVAKLLSIASS